MVTGPTRLEASLDSEVSTRPPSVAAYFYRNIGHDSSFYRRPQPRPDRGTGADKYSVATQSRTHDLTMIRSLTVICVFLLSSTQMVLGQRIYLCDTEEYYLGEGVYDLAKGRYKQQVELVCEFGKSDASKVRCHT